MIIPVQYSCCRIRSNWSWEFRKLFILQHYIIFCPQPNRKNHQTTTALLERLVHNAWGAPYGTDPQPFSLDGSLSQWQQSQPWIYNRFAWQRLVDGLAGLVWHIRWKLLAFILPVLIFDQSSEFLCSLVDFSTLAACSLPQDISTLHLTWTAADCNSKHSTSLEETSHPTSNEKLRGLKAFVSFELLLCQPSCWEEHVWPFLHWTRDKITIHCE